MDNKLKIINYLGKNRGKSFTMHELSKRLDIPYASFYRTIQTMSDLIKIKKIGKSKTIELNTKNPITQSYLVISSDEEKKEFLKDHALIKKLTNEIDNNDIVVLFGSYAKGKQNEKSDIDLLIINKDGKKSLSFSKIELLYKKKFNPIFVKVKEFTQMLKAKEENVGKQALESNIILNRPEKFWRLIFNTI